MNKDQIALDFITVYKCYKDRKRKPGRTGGCKEAIRSVQTRKKNSRIPKIDHEDHSS